MNTQIERWKKRLLDLGRQNRLLNYKETKRGNLKITSPDLDELYFNLVHQKTKYRFVTMNNVIAPNEIDTSAILKTNKTVAEQQHILKTLKDKAKTVMEEQGISTMFLAFGFLSWKDKENQSYLSPLVLVPVQLTTETLTSPYELKFIDEEVIVNPTLSYKLEQEYGWTMPSFFGLDQNILDYLIELSELVSSRGWDVELECALSLFSYLKMKMYQDIEDNQTLIESHPILKAFGGDVSEIKTLSDEWNHYNHDMNSRPTDTFQVVDADSSQQDAILYSKQGISFVLQGPPGTGKSQTITNIIAEALAQDKKVLFVSEKMAALEVVYKRMSEVGLAEFCLPLHSHKANKKEVLDELNNTLHLDTTSMKEESLYQLDLLQEHRKRLNQYAQQLHTVCPPLNQSIYEINGRLAKLYMRPDVEFEMTNVAEVTQEQLHQYVYVLNEYEKVVEKMSYPVPDHPWNHCNVTAITHDLRLEIQTKADQLHERISNLVEVMTAIMKEYQIVVPSTYEGCFGLVDILQASFRAPKLSKHWLYEQDLQECLKTAKLHQGLQEEYHRLQEVLNQMFVVDYENIDAVEAIELLTMSMGNGKEMLNPTFFMTNNDIISNLSSLIEVIDKERQLLSDVLEVDQQIAKILHSDPCETVGELKNRGELLELLACNPHPTVGWFDKAKWKSNLNRLREIQSVTEFITQQVEHILKQYDDEILTIDYETMLQRFHGSYQSGLKMLKKDYRRDMETLRGLAYEPELVDDKEAIRILTEIKGLQENKQWLLGKRDWMKRFLGVYYAGNQTDWSFVYKKMQQFRQIVDFYGDIDIPSELIQVLLEQDPVQNQLQECYYRIQSFIYGENLQTLSNIFRFQQTVEELNLSYVADLLTKSSNELSIVQQIMSLMQIPKDSNMPYSEALSTMKKLKRYQYVEDVMEESKSSLKLKFANMYTGVDTNWEEITYGLLWIDEMKLLGSEYTISDEFLEQCITHTNVEGRQEAVDYFIWCIREVNDLFQWYQGLFDESYDLEREKLNRVDLKLHQVCNDERMLDEWVEYKTVLSFIHEQGLMEFIQEVEEMKINPTTVADTFRKRFYQLWLDQIVPQYSAVNTFGSISQEETRNDFDKLDVCQFDIARSRIRQRLLSNLPSLDASFSANDEIGILKRELNKKHKTMPLRKLFEAIPNLIFTLKPCFMMSPLSVSLFLQEKGYTFDLVIFDEASQIPTEDAIGAMLRGKQVIIAGDSEQLPPTNFFKANVNGEEQVEIDDEKDQFESILEEAQTILPERTLRWHYRSRHESLIAFSNAKIYNHNLITFPSTVEQGQDCGVEYVYVEDGVYDRGGKKHNINEAKRVASLVMDELLRYPDRSLGVITFSEAQQHAVEQQIMELRLEHKELEDYFDTNRLESFFVKNLENVQGDERDTIIFSIGYGKDEQGNLLMNFGPLSRKGGYRRLNVAITRAKYNVKMVGSIHPSEMKMESTSSEGVKMLHSYMEYAINRQEVMKKELMNTTYVNEAAPFEESIYEYLVSHGYKVATKVGCSGYRIDLAILHPTIENRYIFGIECDGATYRAARTARERERLRQTVLKDMGWNIYRVWSTDWIKNPFIEGQKLLEAIEHVVKEYE